MNEEYRTIGIDIYEPFKQTERAEVTIYKCQLLNDCPIYKENKCLMTGMSMCRGTCKYGKRTGATSQTKRAKSYSPFVEEWKKKKAEFKKSLGTFYDNRMLVIGDWVYLPYAHMNHRDGKHQEIPFEQYSGFMMSGSKFIELEKFTPEVIVKLKKLKPSALMGGEITSYQEKELPNFFMHLQKLIPDLYEKACRLDPEIREYTKRIKFPAKLNCPIKYIPKGVIKGYVLDKNIVAKKWDGITMTAEYEGECMISCFNSYSKVKKFQIKIKPDLDKTKVSITDEEFTKELCLKHVELLK